MHITVTPTDNVAHSQLASHKSNYWCCQVYRKHICIRLLVSTVTIRQSTHFSCAIAPVCNTCCFMASCNKVCRFVASCNKACRFVASCYKICRFVASCNKVCCFMASCNKAKPVAHVHVNTLKRILPSVTLCFFCQCW